MRDLISKYEILNLKESYNKKDYIEGLFYLENKNEKIKKLFNIQIQLIEIYGTLSHNLKENIIYKYIISRGDKIRSEEKKKYLFKFNLDGWNPKNVDIYKYWFLVLVFKKKTGLRSTLGKNLRSSIFYIPMQEAKYPKSIRKILILNKNKMDNIIICSECGVKMRNSVKFCEICGNDLSSI